MNKDQECAELKNIRYKTMLLSGSAAIAPEPTNHDLVNVESILDRERDRDQKEPWNRLDKTTKVQKLLAYTEDISTREGLCKADKAQLRSQLIGYLDKKLLQRNKDVLYDKDKGTITDIPTLEYTTASRRFTLRRANKSVIPKTTKTRKKTEKIDSNNKD